MYKFKRYEYDLTKEEQEQARFIIKEAQAKNKRLMTGEGRTDGLERDAFIQFKESFYSSVATRLLLRGSRGAFSLTEDAKKLVRLVVENT